MHKGCVIVPVRDRQTHLDCFLLYMKERFSHLPIIAVEQLDKSAWNKGLLFNAAFNELGKSYDYVILHDVDFIPDRKVDYSYTQQPTLLATECSQFNYTHYFHSFFGGVVGISNEHYNLVNGFSNLFRGYGGEDCDFRNRCIAKGLTPMKREGNRFECFDHPKPNIQRGSLFWQTEDYQNNLKMAESQPDFSSGLNTAKYELVSINNYLGATYLKINTNG